MPGGALQISNLQKAKYKKITKKSQSITSSEESETENVERLANINNNNNTMSESARRRSRSRTKQRATHSTSTNSNSSSSSTTGSHQHPHHLTPIETLELDPEENSPRDSLLGGGKSIKSKSTNKGSKSLKTRARSISPHARAILSRTFSRSRSRSASRSRTAGSHQLDNDDDDDSSVASIDSSSSGSGRGRQQQQQQQQLLVAVTSCRSDAYHAQKAPGATSMLPRKAPSALKTFHELAVGVKDAYEAMGATPMKPDEESDVFASLSSKERIGRKVLWEFNGNLNFLLALVDEVATDSATRGALKDDQAFKNLRDVIKKCNKVLEKMLVRRDNKFTLFFRLVQPHDAKEIGKMKMWNERVEKAVHSLSSSEDTESIHHGQQVSELVSEVGGGGGGSDAASTVSTSTEASSGSKGGGLFRRGRGLLPTAGRVRARRATPTPSLRNRFSRQDAPKSSAEDGFARSTPVTSKNLAKLQNTLDDGEQSSMTLPGQFVQSEPSGASQSTVVPMAPKDELVDVIKGLRNEQSRNEVSNGVQPGDLKPNWLPKGDIPITVPKLPVEYIHRHRLMKQVVNSLLDRQTASQDEGESPKTRLITSITSRHADKAGNGKTTLAVAAIQTVEVRERFSDGIAWIQLGRAPLTEKNIKRLYEELYDQLLKNDIEINTTRDADVDVKSHVASEFLKSRMQFQSGDLEGMKEDLGHILSEKRVLICLDDVWRVDDAKRFIFPHVNDKRNESYEKKMKGNPCPYRVLLTTRTPGLLGHGNSCEVFVRIFSENEAVKLLLSAAGRRLYGGKNSPVFNQARVIVKGCGNSPLALRLAGGMLRRSNRNWTLSSPTWLSLVDQCRSSLEEASKIRSFVNSVGRVVDLSFITVQNVELRTSLRRCFVTFAMVFRDNELLLTGKGIPRSVVKQLFQTVISVMTGGVDSELQFSPDTILEMLVHMNLLQLAGHGANHESYSEIERVSENSQRSTAKSLINGSLSLDDGGSDDFQSTDLSEDAARPAELTSYLMHESIKCIAEDMSTRKSTSFAPIPDDFTSFNDDLEAESQKEDTDRHWFSSAARFLFSSNQDQKYSIGGTSRPQFHELMVCALSGGSSELERGQIAKLFEDNKNMSTNLEGGDIMEKYIASYLPNHLITAGLYTDASCILMDDGFIRRRMSCLGVAVATRRHMNDVLDLRREFQRVSDGNGRKVDPSVSQSDDTPHLDLNVDMSATQREASRVVLEAVYEGERSKAQSASTLHMASCLYAVGEAFLKARLFRESIRHMEKCIAIFQEILGSHIDVARSLNLLSKGCLKLGDSESALAKLEEAKAVYEQCDAMVHYEAIANSHHMATLYLDTGNWDKASLEYQNVMTMKSNLYGGESLPVAKALNEFAVILAKNNRLSEALQRYEGARTMYESISKQSYSGLVFIASLGAKNAQHKFLPDVTLIDLNIASLNSKLSNYQGALKSYERGVAGLRLQLKQEDDSIDKTRQVAQRRHLVSAIARIGSLRMKLKDNSGALKAYMVLIQEVDHTSPTPSQMEKAKAHVKCATIFRQSGGKENNENAVSQLELALQMYTILHGQNHKDTKAIASSLRQWQRIDSAQPRG